MSLQVPGSGPPLQVLFLVSFIDVQYHRADSRTAQEQDWEVQQAGLWHLVPQAIISMAKMHAREHHHPALNPNFIQPLLLWCTELHFLTKDNQALSVALSHHLINGCQAQRVDPRFPSRTSRHRRQAEKKKKKRCFSSCLFSLLCFAHSSFCLIRIQKISRDRNSGILEVKASIVVQRQDSCP